MSTYLGWTVVSLPTDPAFPKSFEFQPNALTAVNTNPFTGAQQIQNWSTGFYEASVTWQPMTFTQAQNWVTFLTGLVGMTNVFKFTDAINAVWPKELTTDGTTARYWRLQNNKPKWSIGEGNIYTVTFEIREAI
jgi:hypothetical protein